MFLFNNHHCIHAIALDFMSTTTSTSTARTHRAHG